MGNKSIIKRENSYDSRVKDGIIAWLETVRYNEKGWGRWKYNAGMIRPYALRASSLAIEQFIIPWQLIDHISTNDRRDSLLFFQSCQDVDGYFKDPLVSDQDLAQNQPFNWTDIWLQMGSANTITALGGTPTYPQPRITHVDYDAGKEVHDWISQLDWSNPWLQGERFARSVYTSYAARWQNRNIADATGLATAFDFIEEQVLNPVTGMPDKAGCHEPDTAMAGLFKIMFAYLAVKRPLPFARAAIDATLALQSPAGDFAVRPDLPEPDGDTYILRHRRDMCINWDAIWVLRELDRQELGRYRHEEIIAAARRFADCMLTDYRKPDGGFAFAADHCLTVHMGIKLSRPLPESDMLGTWMCVESLRYLDEWLTRDANTQ